MVFAEKCFVLTAEDGALVALVRIDRVVPAVNASGAEAFARAWCGGISQGCERWARERLPEEARQTYADDPAPNKRVSFPRFLYTLHLAAEERGGEVTVTASAVLSRGGKCLGVGEASAVCCAEGIRPPERSRQGKRKKN